MTLAELEILRHPWSKLRVLMGFADEVPNALKALLESQTPEEADRAYWRLDNRVVVQGSVFQAAEFVVPVLLTALTDERPRFVKISILELLFQIVAYEVAPEEIHVGNAELLERCRSKAREGLWILYREMLHGERESAQEVLEIIETDRDRLTHVQRALKNDASQ